MRPSREMVARGAIFEDLRLRVQRGIQETAGGAKKCLPNTCPNTENHVFSALERGWRSGAAFAGWVRSFGRVNLV